MPGSRSYKNNTNQWFTFLFALIPLLLWGCASTEQPSRSETVSGTLTEFLAKYERTFRPSDYKLDFKLIKTVEEQQFNALHSATVYTTSVAETIPGFRIQVLLTQEIDEANAALSNLEQQLPEDFAYMAYDAPYYKIRIGNFAERSAANATLKRLIGLGYKEAWIVPDNILKNPPPKLTDTFIEPKRLINDNR